MPVPTASTSFSSLSRAKASVEQLLVGASPSLRNVRLGGISEHTAGSLPESSLAGIKLDSSAPSNTTLLHVSLQFSAIRWNNGHLALIPHSLAGPKGTSRISMDPTLLGAAPLAAHSSGTGPPPLYLGPDFALSPELHTDSVWVAATVRDSPVVQVFQTPANGIPESHEQMSVPSAILAGHERQATHVAFHPLVSGLLATAARDDTLLLWDVEKMAPITSLTATAVTSLGFDRHGERIAWVDANTSSIMLMDPRATGPSSITEIPQTFKAGSRYTWLSPQSLVTCGSRGPETFIACWDPRNTSTPSNELQIQNVKSSGTPILMPDPSLQAVYFATRGESSIKTFHCRNGTLELAADCKATKQHYAVAALPKLAVNPRFAEIARFCRIREDGIMELAPMTLLRKESHISLQADLYPALETMSTSLKPGDLVGPDKMAFRPDTFQFKAVDAAESGSPTSPVSAVATLVLAQDRATPAVVAAELTRSLSTMSRKLSIRSIVAMKGLVTSGTASSSLAALAEDLPVPCSTVMRRAIRPHSLASWSWTTAHVELMSHGRLVIVEQSPNVSMFFHINKDIDAATAESDTLVIRPKGGMPIVRLQCNSTDQAQEWCDKLNPYINIRLLPRAPVRIASKLEVLLPASLATPVTQGHSHSPSPSISSAPLSTGTFRSCYVTLEDTGHILFYPDESAFIQPDLKRPAFAMLEIKDMLSVRFTDLMNGNEYGADAMTMTTFTATLASSQVILRARSKHDAANWIVSLHQVAMLLDSHEADSEELAGSIEEGLSAGNASAGSPLDCEVDEGPIIVQNHSAAIPSLSANNGSCWLSVLRTQLFYLESSTSTRVLARIDRVHSIVIDPAAATISVACERGTIVHLVERSQFSWWKQVFERLFRASGTLLRDLGISKDTWAKLDLGNTESSIVPLASVAKGQLPMLAVIRGRNAPVQVVPVHYSELDDADACVLDLGSTIYQWNGPASSLPVRARAMDLANKIRSKERKNQASIIQITQNQPRTALFDFLKRLSYSLDEVASFKRASEPVIPASSGGLRLYRVYLELHSPQAELIYECIGTSQEQPRKKHLDTSSVIVLVDEPNELWIWVGKQSSALDRKLAMTVAARMHFRVQFRSTFRIQEGFEPMVFQHKFADMDTSLPIALRPAKPGHSRIASSAVASSKQSTIDLDEVLARAEATDRLATEQVAGKLKDTDKVELFLVEDFTTRRIPGKGAALTALARNEAYIVLHTEILSASKRCTGYFFQGSSATQLDKGSSALLTVALCKDAKAAADVSQVRVEEGLEPASFFGLFEAGEIMLLMGSSNAKSGKKQGDGSGAATMHAVVDVRVTRHGLLVAKECLVDLSTVAQFHFSLILGSKGVVHNGSHAPSLTGTMLSRIRSHFKTWDLATVKCGPEKASATVSHPRLFSVSNASGQVTAEYVWPFAQSSLSRNSVHVLDTTRTVFCWLGSEVETAEIVHALKFGIQMCEHLGRKKVMVVYPGQEPGEFTACFHGWIGPPVPLESSKAMLQEAKFYLSELTRTVYSLKELQSMDLTKAFVDLTRLEDYLSDAEFDTNFKMTREAFKGLPLWKQENIKKEVGLY